MKKVLVILDNGHGINTPGKCSPDKLFREYAYARMFVKRLKTALEAQNYEVVILVPEEEDIGLSIRAARANEIYNKYKATHTVVLISIHNNAAPGNGWSNARGWAAYTSVGKTESDRVCRCLYDAAEVYLKDYIKNFSSPEKAQRPIRSTKDESKGYEDNFTIITKTKCPAVLTENLFQNNREDVAFLTSEEGIQALIDLHVAGIMKWAEGYDIVPVITH